MRPTALLLLLCALLLACNQSATPAKTEAAPRPTAAAPPSAPAKVPDFEFEPLAESDVDLYLGIMRAAVDKFRHLPAADQATLQQEDDYYRHLKSGWHPSPTEKEAALFKRSIELHHVDYDIAKQKGVYDRYSAIAEAIEGMVGPMKCGDSDCGQGPDEDAPAARKQQLADDKKRKAIVKLDLVLLQSHAAEILALATELRMMPNEREHRK
jgi:hypothetical protein